MADARILEAALEQAPGHIIVTDDDMTVLYVNRVAHGYSREQILGSKHGHTLSPEQARRVEPLLARARATGQPQQFESFIDPPSGERQWYLTQITAFQGQDGGPGGMISIITELTQQRLAEQKVERLRKELVQASHRAGMAEIATGVLHNVGNVLNSINVSSEALERELEGSRLTLLDRAVTMLDEHADELPQFLSDDPRGSKLPTLLRKVTDELGAEHQRLQKELTRLRDHLALMRDVVDAQQSIAKLGVMAEPVKPSELVEQTLSMFQLDIENRVIELRTELADLGPMVLDKQSVLQVLANLVRNAIEALETINGQRLLSIRVDATFDTVCFEVEDNGMGIEAEHLAKVFEHGFSTKANGHGFGLHASSVAARIMNGSLEAHSAGPGTGACMRLLLPRILP